MNSPLQAAATVDDLLRIDDPAIPYAFPQIFHGQGWRARMRFRGKLKLLKQLDADLRAMLHEGERVVLVTWGIEYSFVEAWFMGLWSYLLNRRAIVMTSKRMLVLQISSRRKLLKLKSQVRYEAIRKVPKGRLRLVLQKGRSVLFTAVPGPDRKLVRKALEHFRANLAAATGASRENLCPHCYAAVDGFPASCAACGGAFKSPRKAALLSLLLPGLGDLYLGLRSLAVVELLGAGALWAVVINGMLVAETAEGAAPVGVMALVMALPIFAFVHGIDALVTAHTARKGIYPA